MTHMTKNRHRIAAAFLAGGLIGGAILAAPADSQAAVRGSDGRTLLDVSTYAGSGDWGSANAVKLLAEFRSPAALLAMPDGSVLTSDESNHLIRWITDAGTADYAGIILRKDAGGFPEGGLLDGESDTTLFNGPAGLATDAAGNVYVADSGNHAIRVIAPDGGVRTLAGNGRSGNADGSGASARFNEPRDVAVAKDGTVFVADTLNHVIRKIDPSGAVTTLTAPSDRVVEAFPGQAAPAGDFADGDIAKAKFNEPSGLAIDAKGNLYVSDSGNQRIRYVDFASGKVTTVAGTGTAETGLYAESGFRDGNALEARFNRPAGIALTAEGGLVIADSLNHSIRYLLNGEVATLAGSPSHLPGETDGVERSSLFREPTDIAILQNGDILVADSLNNRIRLLDFYELPGAAVPTKGIKVVLGDRTIAFDAQPLIVQSRTYVPIRAVAEALGYSVGNMTKKGDVRLTQGDKTVAWNVADSGFVKRNRAYVPVRFFAERLGLDVQWHQATNTVILRRNAE